VLGYDTTLLLSSLLLKLRAHVAVDIVSILRATAYML